MSQFTDKHPPHALPPFWQDRHGQDRTPYFNFYRFCQWLEQASPERPALGSTFHPGDDSVRFRPHPGMGFPVSELKATETDAQHPERPPTVRTTFLGLYGVESPLPTSYIDDISQRREGHDVLEAFLDIFNHRLTTQYYRSWRKYSYPATFEAGGKDPISQHLLALIGAEHSPVQPTSRLLALLGPLMLPTRTAQGIVFVVQTQAPDTQVEVIPHHPVKVNITHPAQLSRRDPVRLGQRPVLGNSVIEANKVILVKLTTHNPQEAQAWLPGGQLHEDVMTLLRVYLGCHYDALLTLTVPIALLPLPRLNNKSVRIGYTGVLGLTAKMQRTESDRTVTVKLGRTR